MAVLLSGALTIMSVLLVFVGFLLATYQRLFGPDNSQSQRRSVLLILRLVVGLVTIAAIVSLGALAQIRGADLEEIVVWTFVSLVILTPIVAFVSVLLGTRN